MKTVMVVPPADIKKSDLIREESSLFYIDNASPSFSLSYLATDLLENGHDVRGYDARFDQHKPLDTIVDNILTDKPDIIAISVTTSLYNQAIRLSEKIKQKSNSKIILGGPHVSSKLNSHPKEKPIQSDTIKEFKLHKHFFAEAALRGVTFEKESFPSLTNNTLIDAVYIGDCTNSSTVFEEILKGKHPEGTAIIDKENSFNYKSSSIKFKFLQPSFEIFDTDRYQMLGTTITSHGCPMLCSYCTCPSTTDRKYYRTSIESTKKEISSLVEKYDIKNLRINDDAITFNKEWLKEFCDMISEFEISWQCFARADHVDYNSLQYMKQSGCETIQFGIETGSNQSLKQIYKNLTTEQIKEGFQKAVDSGISLVRGGIIFGFPFDNIETLVETADLMESLYSIGPNVDISVSSLTPYPGSLTFDSAIEGYHKKQSFRPIHFDFDNYIFHETNLINETFPTQQKMSEAYNILYANNIALSQKYEVK